MSPNSIQHSMPPSGIAASCAGVRGVPRPEPAHVRRIQPAVNVKMMTYHGRLLSPEVNKAEMDTIFTLYRRIIRLYSRYGGAGGRKMHRGQANRKCTCTISLLTANGAVTYGNKQDTQRNSRDSEYVQFITVDSGDGHGGVWAEGILRSSHCR